MRCLFLALVLFQPVNEYLFS